MNDFISKKAVISITNRETVTTNPDNFTANEKFNDYMGDPYISSFGKWMFNNGYNTALATVRMEADKLPIADVAPVVYGHWIYLGGGLAKCSVCKRVVKGCYDYDNEDLFCRKCGAKMDERSTLNEQTGK